MEYFNLRSGRCTCGRLFSMKHLADYDTFPQSERSGYMNLCGAYLDCCRNLFVSPHVVTLTKQKKHKVFRNVEEAPLLPPRGVCKLYRSDKTSSKETMMLAIIPEEHVIPGPEKWVYPEGEVIFPNNADIVVNDRNFISDHLIPGHRVGSAEPLSMTREYTKRTYLIW